ncbi:NIPSNAP family protein [Devosia sp.]|uniref:NIPSNAP family protein n=1 Tax=Devosia sp. TaxID=1871048 RepID=UPI003F6FAB18
MIYELRIYTCLPGRLPDLQRRFQDHTLALWERHGIEQAGFWTTVIGNSNNDLTYMVRWNSMAERETKWTTFATDPDWIAARNASEANGPLLANVTSQFLSPTSFSSVK